MKTFLTMTVIVVLGVALTTAIALARLGTPLTFKPLTLDLPAEESEGGSTPSAPVDVGAVAEAQPMAVVEQDEFDFGNLRNKTMDNRHVFKVRNDGQAPLHFKGSSVSCNKCTFVDLPDAPVEPGETGEIVVRWNVETMEDHFRQSATVKTDDPEHEALRFVISGKVVRPLVIEPQKLVLSNVQVGQPAEAKVSLTAYFDDHLELLKRELTDEANARFFEITSAPLPNDKLPKGAKSGIELTVKLKPGLPVGSFSQGIRIQTNVEGEEETIIPVNGEVGGAVNIFGKDWERDLHYLNIGNVRQSQGDKRTVYVLMHGLGSVKLDPPEVNEDVLKVKYGEITSLKGGALVKVPVEIEIPPASPLVNHMGGKGKLAEIVIPTDKSELGRVKLLVKFAVVAD
jgi:hypothetical protein